METSSVEEGDEGRQGLLLLLSVTKKMIGDEDEGRVTLTGHEDDNDNSK